MDPAEIIAESRELRVVSVWLGHDNGSPRELRTRLAELCRLIGSSESGSLAHANYVSRYNSVLHVLMPTLEYEQEILAVESRLDDDLILLDYLEYEKNLEENGPYTLAKLWSHSEVVALIRTYRKRLLFRRRISVDLVRAFKGEFPKGYSPVRDAVLGHGFSPKRQYVVFWDQSGQEFVGPSWEIFHDAVVVHHGERFWPFPVERAYGSGVRVRWSSLEPWLVSSAKHG